MQACLQNVQWENYQRVSNYIELVYSRTILQPNNNYTMLWRILLAVECKESENTSRNLRIINAIGSDKTTRTYQQDTTSRVFPLRAWI